MELREFAAIAGVAATITGFGYVLGAIGNGRLISEKAALEGQLASERSLASALKIEQARGANGPAIDVTTIGSPPDAANPEVERGYVYEGSSTEFFGGEFFVSLAYIDFAGPRRFKYTFVGNAGASSSKTTRIMKADAGYRMVSGGYELRIMKIASGRASVRVERMDGAEVGASEAGDASTAPPGPPQVSPEPP